MVWTLAVALALPPPPIAEESLPAATGEVAPAAEPPPAPVTTPAEEPEPAPPPVPPAPAAPTEPQPTPESPAATATPDAPEPAEAPAQRPRAFAAAPGSVVIEDFSFSPSSITVGVGETVTWRNEGPSAHTATATDGSFDTGLLDAGESGSARFDRAGTFSYLCEPHPFMKGTVRVVAAPTGGGGGDGGSGTSEPAVDPSGAPAAGGTTDPATGATLPATGAEPLGLALTGIGLLLIGMVGRRRAVT
jgi:plastocyanin